ncbi:MAG: hypothetical protein OXR82_14835, partial [Gammaproteobacteria bacterium]|nr:hypothetical protein [Gammaproteobacteria bacterium]
MTVAREQRCQFRKREIEHGGGSPHGEIPRVEGIGDTSDELRAERRNRRFPARRRATRDQALAIERVDLLPGQQVEAAEAA